MAEYKFTRTEGLPKGDGAKAYRYFGFDADNAAFLMRWSDPAQAWVAAGFDPRGEPVVFVLRDQNADLIKSHALCPPRWSELGLPAREQPTFPGMAS